MPESSQSTAALSARALSHAIKKMGGSARPGQESMLERVSEVLEEKGIALIQAGTGTGKSLAYLIPAMIRAAKKNERIIISTATLALQRQLMSIDIPRAVESLTAAGVEAPAVALLKGRHNYLCQHKITGGYPSDDVLFDESLLPQAAPEPATSSPPVPKRATDLGAQVVQLRAWANTTSTGDRDDMPEPVSERAWQQVSVSARECIGTMCPMVQECFSEKARTDAAVAQVVITNHALLGVAAAGHPVLGEYDGIIIDEAHELVDRVRSQSTVMLTPGIVERVDRSVRKAGVASDALGISAGTLRTALEEITPQRFSGQLPASLIDSLDTLRSSARDAMTACREGSKESAAHKVALARATELHAIANRLLSDRLATQRDVVWVQESSTGSVPFINVAPLQVARDISEALLEDHSAVLTSATLTIARKFDHFARSVGLSKGGFETLDVGSPFNYRKQGILYIAEHLPPRGREGLPGPTLDEIVELVKASGGAALGLFTSQRAAEEAAAYVRENLDIPILVQGEAPIGYLHEKFMEDREICLFGTRSLWQGIDVPGEVCQLVIIDRIPFPRPDDPITTAQQELVKERGGNAFMEVAVADAALTLAQGVGRLIRRVEDQGVVAILDPRLAKARYGAVLRQSLPEMWPTADPAIARSALGRLKSTNEAKAS